MSVGAIHYDAARKRVWIREQRVHHGMVGTLLAAAGVILMAHDWQDRGVWFQRGRQP